MATLEDALSQAEPLERVGWLVYAANWFEQEADRRGRQPASSRISAAEAQELTDFRAFASGLRQQADIELHREVNRGAVSSAAAQRRLQRPSVRRNAARSNRELDRAADAMAEDGRSAAIAKAMAREVPERPGGGTPDPSVVQRAQDLVRLRRSAYATGSTQHAMAANEAHALLNTHLNRVARREIARGKADRDQGTGGPLPGVVSSGLNATRRDLAADPRSGSGGTASATTNPGDGRQRGHGLEPRQSGM